MDVVMIFQNRLKSKVMAKIEGDKYDENSFGKKGYVLKDGQDFGFPNKTLLVIRGVNEQFLSRAKDLLKEYEIEILEENKTHEIVDKIKEEEEATQSGFGSIFG